MTGDIQSYIISLNSATSKINYLKKNNINVKLFAGIDGKRVSDTVINEYFYKYKHLPKGTIGCALSHMKLWELAIKNNNDMTLVFEEDIVLSENFNYNYLQKCIKNTPDDFDILYLGSPTGYDPVFPFYDIMSLLYIKSFYKPNEKINDYVEKIYFPLGSHAYIISLKGAKKLIKLFKKKTDDAIDVYITKLAMENKIKTYIISRELGYQTSGHNTSDSTNIFGKSPIVVNKLLSKIKISKYFTAEYAVNISRLRLYPTKLNLNYMCIFFLILGTLLTLNNLDFKIINLIFILIFLPDLILFILNKNQIIIYLEYIILYYMFYVSPFLLKITMKRIR